ncbi:integrin beta-PS [Bicyclus anynana]|uniref:Integrin beta n=1 Tax=Bicyclus anynana TaxID=110368 RepID=A0ABM3M750_BICAN|nr:integrin beta-PS [Bicyclus anynana]
MKCVKVILCIFLMFRNVFASNSCELLTNSCEDCIVNSSICVWCAMVNFNGTRCRSANDNLDNWCNGNIINPKSGKKSKEVNLDFSSKTGEIVQIKPQQTSITLRPGQTLNLNFSIKHAEDYPVDVYFLVDASKLMKKVKDTIVKESVKMYKTLKSMTKNVYLGTGSFIDKNTLPFTDSINSTLTYSFRNRLKLTENYEDFQKTVNDTAFGSNYDLQEGTLDALSQVITCENEIGWRKESTKIIIVLTDAPYHNAGDGKWGGINRPYDGKCYSKTDIYKNEIVMDYPSVSLINKLAAEREMIIIYMVDKKEINNYNKLKLAIRGSVTHKYDEHFSMNKVLKAQYKNIKKEIKLKVNMDTSLREYFDISFQPNCYSGSASVRTRKCSIRIGQEKNFKVNLTLLENIKSDNVDINILAEGIKEKLNINIEVIKTCNCTDKHENSKECDLHGTLRCGICECNSYRYGNKCKCDKNVIGVKPNDNSTCISPTSIDKECSGHGACDCGKCSCINKDYTGSFCQCHKNMCPMYNDEVCAGHGNCVCGTCNCDPGFTGVNCRCSTAKNNCMYKDMQCNNRGECKCNSCVQCSDPSDWDTRRNGDLCQLECSETSCHSHQCQLLEPIVLCYLNQEDCLSHPDINITGVSNLSFNYSTNDWAYDMANYSADTMRNYSANDWKHCPNVRTGLGCYTQFVYRYNEDSYGVNIKVQTDAHCAETYYMYGGACAVLLIICGVIGLITWKTVITVRDRREYERFAKAVGVMDENCDNPIYKPTVSTFYNPGFRKRSDRRRTSRN